MLRAVLTLKPCGAVTFTRVKGAGMGFAPPAKKQELATENTYSQGLSVTLTDATRTPPEKKASPRAFRGSRGLTSEAKSKLVFAASYLEQKYGRHTLTFWTATVPTNDPSKLRVILERNKQILKYLRDQLTKYLSQLGLPTEIVLVGELQKRGALHYHAVFVGRLYGLRVDKFQLQAIWRRVLCSQVPLPPNLNFGASCRTEPVRKSVGRYLAKYLSKSLSKETFLTSGLSITWYSVGTNLKQLYFALLNQNRFYAFVSQPVFEFCCTSLSRALICGTIIHRQELLIGARGFVHSPPDFYSLIRGNPILNQKFPEIVTKSKSP